MSGAMIHPRRRSLASISIAAILVTAASRPIRADPLLFTVQPPLTDTTSRAAVSFDTGYGEAGSPSFGFDGVEPRIRLRARLGDDALLLAQVSSPAGTGVGEQGFQELEYLQQLPGTLRGWTFAGGVGVRREAGHETVLLGRLSTTRDLHRSVALANLRLERALSSDRDNLDLIASFGWLRASGPRFEWGLEVVGQDIEGFWTPNEAEGGAVLFAGPSVHFTPPRLPWSFALSTGLERRATQNHLASGAPRVLQVRNGFTARISLSYAVLAGRESGGSR